MDKVFDDELGVVAVRVNYVYDWRVGTDEEYVVLRIAAPTSFLNTTPERGTVLLYDHRPASIHLAKTLPSFNSQSKAQMQKMVSRYARVTYQIGQAGNTHQLHLYGTRVEGKMDNLLTFVRLVTGKIERKWYVSASSAPTDMKPHFPRQTWLVTYNGNDQIEEVRGQQIHHIVCVSSEQDPLIIHYEDPDGNKGHYKATTAGKRED